MQKQVYDALSFSRFVEIVGEEYFHDASPALLTLFGALLQTAPADQNFDVRDLVDVMSNMIDFSYDEELEPYREVSTKRTFHLINTSKLSAARASLNLQLEIRRLANYKGK